jgi:hypothetical protein
MSLFFCSIIPAARASGRAPAREMAPPLHEAVMKGDEARVRALLDAGDAADTANDVRARAALIVSSHTLARALPHAGRGCGAAPGRRAWICAACACEAAGRRGRAPARVALAAG